MATNEGEKAKVPTGNAQDDKPEASGTPSAGPHAKPELTNPDATPGAGSLPPENPTGEADAGSG